jgi:hypothetical protein
MKSLTRTNYAMLSLISITLTSIVTAVHHIYRLGLNVLLPAAIIILLPYVLMRWFQHSRNKATLSAYGLLNALIVVWFGLIDGFLDHVLKALGFQNLTFLPGSEAEVVQTVFSLWSVAAGNVFCEGSGILTFIVSLFAVYYGYRFIQAQLSSEMISNSRLPRPTQ